MTQSKEGVVVSQKKYDLDVIEEIRLENSKPIDNPINPNQKLKANQD